MKKLISLCALGLSMAFLTGCNDSGKDISGVYTGFETSSLGKESTIKVELDKLDGSKGYNITLSTTKYGSDVFNKSYDWGRGVLVGEFVVRERDDKKVFEVLEDGSLKSTDFEEQTVFTKVEG